MPPLKVAHLTTVDLSLRYLLLAQLQAVVEAGGTAVGISAPGPHVEALEAAGVRHIAIESSTRAMSPLADLRAARELWRILRRERPDVLHTHNPKPGVYGRIIGRLAGVPAVVNTTHGLYATTDDSWPRRFAVYLLEAVASRFSHAELCQNPEDLDLMLRRRLVPRRKARVLGNGVDLDRFNPGRVGADERAAIRRTLGFDDEEIVIGIVARLVAEKGLPELLDAVAHLGPPFRLLVVGPDDPDKPDALPRHLVRDATAGGVVFAGHRDDVERMYAAMDIYVLPSRREGFPRSAMEAAAMALPIVATDIRGCRQVVDDGVSGVLVPVGDPAALGAALRSLAAPDVCERMGVASRAKAVAEFDERRVVATVLKTYEELLGRPITS